MIAARFATLAPGGTGSNQHVSKGRNSAGSSVDDAAALVNRQTASRLKSATSK
jgi:hypothetical protein